MTRYERLVSIVAYLSKVVDYLQGGSYGKDIYHSRSSKVPQDVKKQALLLGAKESDPVLQNRTERKDTRK